MKRDLLLLLRPGFGDPERPGHLFVCPHSNAIEGQLSSFPHLAARLDVERLEFARPRARAVALVGEDNQSLPVLVFGDEAPPDAVRHGNTSFTNQPARILELLAERHGFPRLH